MKIRMTISVPGTFHSVYKDVKRGDIVDIDDGNARRYLRLGYAQSDLKGELRPAYTPERPPWG
jgi:hypothetical protein